MCKSGLLEKPWTDTDESLQNIPVKFFNGSKKFLQSKYLLTFQAGISKNFILFVSAISFSKESSSQTQINSYFFSSFK
jgi:hypothetical protein